ncbi:MAG: hypothetical protein KF781_00335 [Chitinophagaceae bacterium]|nr:hypothetical protein [Chitinophagaceae bacterium]MCW5905181.1 hypothetical protein [Chitinophagaceae bacterium]
MYSIIYKYFLLNKKLSIPGIGFFSIKEHAAKFNDEGNALLPPEQTIHFTKETALADKHFYAFLAKELHTEQVDAIKNFHDFAYQLQENIAKTEGAVLHGIGTLKKQPSGDYSFETEDFTQNYFPSISIKGNNTTTVQQEKKVHQQPTITDNFKDIEFLTPEELAAEEAALHKDYWWIFAIALGVIGIAAILYKFLY